MRVNAAKGSYIRLVLLNVRTTCLLLSFFTCCVCCYLAFSANNNIYIFSPTPVLQHVIP